MFTLSVIAITFGLIFVAELPDKTAVARARARTSLGYGVIFLAQWGDLTQILTANLAARYDDPISVAIGATLGLWSVALLAIFGGKTLLAVLPLKWITRVTAAVMAALGIYSLVTSIRGLRTHPKRGLIA